MKKQSMRLPSESAVSRLIASLNDPAHELVDELVDSLLEGVPAYPMLDRVAVAGPTRTDWRSIVAGTSGRSAVDLFGDRSIQMMDTASAPDLQRCGVLGGVVAAAAAVIHYGACLSDPQVERSSEHFLVLASVTPPLLAGLFSAAASDSDAIG